MFLDGSAQFGFGRRLDNPRSSNQSALRCGAPELILPFIEPWSLLPWMQAVKLHRGIGMPYAGKSSPTLLNSWKEIALYLGRGVRSAQRWERELRLPVHRTGTGKRSPVYTLVPELNFWLTTAGVGSLRPKT